MPSSFPLFQTVLRSKSLVSNSVTLTNLPERPSVLSMGVAIGASTKIVDRQTGDIHFGRVPSFSVVVPGALPSRSLPDGSPGPSLYCAVIVKRVDAQTRAKTSINELLRD